MTDNYSDGFSQACRLHQAGQLDNALEIYFEIIAKESDFWQAHQNIGLILFDKGQSEVGLAYLFKAHYLCPTDAMCINNIAFAFHSLGKFREATFYYQKALSLDPNASFILQNYAYNYLSQGELFLAKQVFDELLKHNPNNFEARKGQITALLLKGDLTLGFKLFNQMRQIQRTEVYQRFSQPIWQGEPIQDKVLFLHETEGSGFGFGDMIHFARYIPWAASLAKKVIVECKQPLVRLFQQLGQNIQVIPQKTSVPDFDIHMPINLFPVVHRTDLDSILADPYIHIPKDWALSLQLPETDKIKIGVVWAGMPGRSQDKKRSCPLTQLLTLLQLPKIKFYSLQKGPAAQLMKEHQCSELIEDLDSRLEDFASTAAIIHQLDLVISVDTAVAHLAGAMGKPVWLMLPYDPDWRWMLNRSDSPWYPSARLFRSPEPYAWDALMLEIKKALIEKFKLVL